MLYKGRGQAGWFSCQKENDRRPTRTHQMHVFKWRVHSHPRTGPSPWALYPKLTSFMCLRRLHTFPELCWWLPCVVCRWWELPFPWLEEGHPRQSGILQKCLQRQSNYRKRHSNTVISVRQVSRTCIMLHNSVMSKTHFNHQSHCR